MRMGRFFVLTVVLGGILTLGGLNELWLALQSREQVEMPMSEFVRARPSSRWVKLTGCRVAYPLMVYAATVRNGTATYNNVSVPVYPNSNTVPPVSVVLCVADRRELGVVMNHRTMGTRTETIEGVIRGGPFYSGFSKKLAERAPWKLADSYVIIDEGKKPSVGSALLMLGGGVALLALFGLMIARAFTRRTAA